MHAAHVKAGVIDGDLIWRAKADKFSGEKEYDVVLVRHYTRLVEEQKNSSRICFLRIRRVTKNLRPSSKAPASQSRSNCRGIQPSTRGLDRC